MVELYLQEGRYSLQRRATPPSSRVLRKEATPDSFPGPSEGWALVGVGRAEPWAAAPAPLCYTGLWKHIKAADFIPFSCQSGHLAVLVRDGRAA